MLADPILLQMKYSRIVALFAERQKITIDEALDFFYHSATYQELREGIADMHCRSDLYIVDELLEEYKELEIKHRDGK